MVQNSYEIISTISIQLHRQFAIKGRVILVDKTDLESMLDEIDFGALLLKWEDSHWTKAQMYPWYQGIFVHTYLN